MRSILLTFFASMLLCTGVALASPTKLAQQGRVLGQHGIANGKTLTDPAFRRSELALPQNKHRTPAARPTIQSLAHITGGRIPLRTGQHNRIK